MPQPTKNQNNNKYTTKEGKKKIEREDHYDVIPGFMNCINDINIEAFGL